MTTKNGAGPNIENGIVTNIQKPPGSLSGAYLVKDKRNNKYNTARRDPFDSAGSDQ